MGVIFDCNKLLLKANNINANLGLGAEQQEFLYLVLALLILAVGRDLYRSEMTENPYYAADTKLSTQLQLHPFVYNLPPIPPFSNLPSLYLEFTPRGACAPWLISTDLNLHAF